MGWVGFCVAQLEFPPSAPQSSHPRMLALWWGCPFLETISRWGQEGGGRTLGPHHLLWLEIMFVISALQLLLGSLPDAGFCPLCPGLYGGMIWWQQPQMNQHRPWAPAQPHTASAQWAGIAPTHLSYWGFLFFYSSNNKKKLQKAFANCPSLAHYHACVFAKHIAKPRLLKLLLRSVCATLQGSWSAHGEVIKWLLELGNGMQILGPPGYFFKKSWSVVTRS